MDCPFCNKANLALRSFYENERFIAMYNLRPFVEGHVLFMPKRHVDSILKLDEAEKKGLMSFADRCVFIALKYADAYQFDLILQEGESAGQSIPHAHFHVLPRKLGDKIGVSKKEWLSGFSQREQSQHGNLTNEEPDRIVKRLKFIAKEHAIQLDSL